MSSSGERDIGGKNEDVQADELERAENGRTSAEGDGSSRIADMLREERERQDDAEEGSRPRSSAALHGYGRIKSAESPSKDVSPEISLSPAPEGYGSPEGSMSIPDDTPSIQGSVLSSPESGRPTSQFSSSRTYSGALRPFERRFQSKLSPSSLQSPRAVSPAFLTPHSRQSSLSSQLPRVEDETDTPQAPWEVVRWTKLRIISGQVFSEAGKRNFGKPTCLAVSTSIAIGTSKGLILIFDYHQTLKAIIGTGTKAAECGSVTALAISADYSTVVGGHADGYIFTWEIARPARPFLQIPPFDRSLLTGRHPNGHVSGCAILHVGFLGTRHTALISADDGGMAFSHLATRGLGAIARSVTTTRLLGRYPTSVPSMERTRKPSSVLAFSPLPLGNVEQASDKMGLTAILTPYLLVIVSTTPIAQTQHKAPRPKAVAAHSALSGCLAWFPAVKLKVPSTDSGEPISRTKLVYCWSNILTVLEVEETEKPQPVEKDKPPDLHFRPRSRWISEEAIVAVQWLSRSVLGVLTISQRLVILEDNTLRMTDSFDLLHKHIFHQDLFSRQLGTVVEHLDEEDSSMHGVVADAFHMSFRAYKGRLFLLGFNDVSVGTLSNWADRLLALMEDGDFIAAIRLATSYYVGSADKLTVGLPDDDDTRHDMVREKLLEMMAASLKYTFSRTPNSTPEDARSSQLKQLAVECFTACISMNELDFLFDDIYEWYEEGSSEDVFLETLEPHILDDEIKAVPPAVLKDLVSHYTLQNRGSRIEELICRLDTRTIDIDQISTLCKQHYLYDALIYVWNQALGDYVSPLIDLLSLVKTVGYDADSPGTGASVLVDSAMKMFPYLAYTLTGRVYPNGLELPVSDASKAKAELYGFIFSGKAIPWPQVGGYVFHTQADASPEPSFPYLRMILKFDTSSFMSMLNEAFEDSFLNGSQDQQSDDYSAFGESDRQVSRSSLTRQYIVSILLEVMSPEEFGPQDAIYLDMFVARNLPKFPQFILLSGSSLHRVLEGLCKYPSDEVADDCQLSVEYLLSIYHPSDLQSLVPLFAQAGFHRVLKSVYKGEKQYAKLLEACLDDKDDREAVFDCVGDCLRPSAGLTAKQTREVQAVIISHSRDLADIDTARTARILKAYAPGLLRQVLDALDDGSQAQYIFLRTLLEPGLHQEQRDLQPSPDISDMGFTERYVRLMCMYDPSRVAGYVSFLKSGDLKLDKVLPAMESLGVVDAAVVLMAREGLVRDAMDRLVKHLGTLELALTGLISAASESPDVANTEEAAEDLLDAVQKYCKVGIWLCKGQTGATAASSRPAAHRKNTTWITEDDLAPHELLWLDLVDTVVRVAKQVSAAAAYALEHPSTEHAGIANADKMTASLRSDVQQAFTALLASTSSSGARLKPPSNQTHSFLLILRAFLTRASQSSPSLSDLRAVIADIFSAYTFEDSLRSLANALLNKDLFAHVADARTLRDRGWRPRGMACGLCERRICGPGAGAGVWDAWERKELHDAEARALRRIERGGGEEARRLERGKGKASVVGLGKMGEGEDGGEGVVGALVVFACRHAFHRSCLDRAMLEEEPPAEGKGRYKCPLCVRGGGSA